MTKTSQKKRGFTLIELIVVIAIISLLSSIVAASLHSANLKARNASRLQKVDQIQKAIEIGITGKANRLPYTLPSQPGTWTCVGKTNCFGGMLFDDVTLNSIITDGIAGGKIPPDPTFKAPQWGDAVLYWSRLTGVAGFPDGAYLYWIMEDVKGDSTDPCGGGKWYADRNSFTVNPSYVCLLRIGDSVTTP